MARPATQIRPVRAERPPYIEAFERFTQANPDRIEAFVAFGLFISSEYEWASKKPAWPSDDAVAYSYQRMLHDTEVEKTIAKANSIVDEHRRLLVTAHEERYLNKKWDDIEARVEALAAKSSRRHFWKGVSEATTGAFCWTMLCISIAVAAALIGVDLIHSVSNITHIQAVARGAPAPNLPPAH
jgi:hypothetical protein